MQKSFLSLVFWKSLGFDENSVTHLLPLSLSLGCEKYLAGGTIAYKLAFSVGLCKHVSCHLGESCWPGGESLETNSEKRHRNVYTKLWSSSLVFFIWSQVVVSIMCTLVKILVNFYFTKICHAPSYNIRLWVVACTRYFCLVLCIALPQHIKYLAHHKHCHC